MFDLGKDGHRLYVQYRKTNAKCYGELNSEGIECIPISVSQLPINSFIAPSSQSIESVLATTDPENKFTIVIEGDSHANLEEMSKIYNSGKYFTCAEAGDASNQVYNLETISRFIRCNERDLDILVTNVNSFWTWPWDNMMFYKGSQTSAKYTLLVIYEKPTLVEYDSVEKPHEAFEYALIGLPNSSDIFEDDRLLEHQENYNTPKYGKPNPTASRQEFLFRSDDFSSLRKLRNHLMYSPHEARLYSFIVDNTEVVTGNPQTEKVVFNLANWESELKYPLIFSRETAKGQIRHHKMLSAHIK